MALTARLVAGLATAFTCLWLISAPAYADPVVAAAGDIACDTSSDYFNHGVGSEGHCRQMKTSDLLVGGGFSRVLPVGDTQYHVGSLDDFEDSYDPSWGRVKSITRPVPGNHEYGTAGARGYFDYFNGRGRQTGPAGDRDKGYYSFDVGSWHLIALNTNCAQIAQGAAANGCAAGSPQERWLRADLATHRNSCTLAYTHEPLFNSGFRGDSSDPLAFWQALYEAGADVVVSADAHSYERFAPQAPNGISDPARGIREFVVGTGGAFFTRWSTVKPNSELRQNTTFGVLALTLHPTSYNWRFVPEPGESFTDAGSGACHGRTQAFGAAPPTGSLPVAVPGITALKLRPSRFSAARTGASVARKRRRPPIGTRVFYRLSMKASVIFRVQRAKSGRERGGRCRKPGRRAVGKRCIRYVNVRGSFKLAGTPGENKFKFMGRIGNRRLASGRYRLLAAPHAAGKRGNTVRALFKVT